MVVKMLLDEHKSIAGQGEIPSHLIKHHVMSVTALKIIRFLLHSFTI